uniref:Transposase n=1 Tax=Heterorhabditis bacteriophora TaxID=37862 RepID=A0A1I7X8T4_HETBA
MSIVVKGCQPVTFHIMMSERKQSAWLGKIRYSNWDAYKAHVDKRTFQHPTNLLLRLVASYESGTVRRLLKLHSIE